MHTTVHAAMAGLALTLAACGSPAPPTPAPTAAPTGTVVAAPSPAHTTVTVTDTGRETEACELMDDPTGRDAGYSPAQFAFMLLRAEPVGDSMAAPTSDVDAAAVMVGAARDYCPGHAADLPLGWVGTVTPGTAHPSVAVGALTLATAIGHADDTLHRDGVADTAANNWASMIRIVNAYLRVGDHLGATSYVKGLTGSEPTASALVDGIATGIVAAPSTVQSAMGIK